MNEQSTPLEYRRTFNLGDYESVTLSISLENSETKSDFIKAQVSLISQYLELLEVRKLAAKQAFQNKLLDFCERKKVLLSKEKELLEEKI